MGAKVVILPKSLIPNFLRACAIVHWSPPQNSTKVNTRLFQPTFVVGTGCFLC